MFATVNISTKVKLNMAGVVMMPFGVVFLIWEDAFPLRKCFKNRFVFCQYTVN